MKRQSLRNLLVIINFIYFACFLTTTCLSYHYTNKTADNLDGLVKGFYQYKSLKETSFLLEEIEFNNKSAEEVKDLIAQSEKSFAEFIKVAPVITQAGIEKTNELKESFERAVNSLKNGDKNNDTARFKKLVTDFTGLIVKYDVTDTFQALNHDTSVSNTVTFILTILTIGLLFISQFIIKKLITSRLDEVSTVFKSIASGDLTKNINPLRNDEIGEMVSNLNGMKNSIKSIILSVKNTSEHIAYGATKIAEGNDQLSSRTEDQASALQETAASMEQIRTTVSSNAQNAQQANQIVQKANETARHGATFMQGIVTTMQEIEESAQKIAEISNVINGIANQTNILALNAAVEAARAGEQGRGFAVVASEVRNLAASSGQAARDINHLINEAVKKVSEGAQFVTSASESMKEIVTSVMQSSEIMQEIAVASDEQSAGITQIAVAMNQIDSVTQKNAQLVEECVQDTHNLSTQVKALTSAISVFKVNDDKAVLH